MTNKHDDKSAYYARMGWCECSRCRTIFYEYEDYETHECAPPLSGVYVKDSTNWKASDDST